MQKNWICLGLMSGTSGDGVDASIIKTNGVNQYESIKDQYFEYDTDTYKDIHNLKETFDAIEISLKKSGIFILEDPSLLEALKKNSYDQFYDEHAYVFSLTALKNLTRKTGLEIFKVEKLNTHGGSNRVFFKKKINQKVQISKKYIKFLSDEKKFGIEKLSTYRKFARNVKKSKNALINIFRKIKNDGKIIIGYGATYKSSTVLNYCGLKNNFIDSFAYYRL